MTPKFKLGQLAMTYTVDAWLVQNPSFYSDVEACLMRHQAGDWGDVDDEDKATNNAALEAGDRVLSVYTIEQTVIWILTEADRSVTTILFPEDY